MYSNFVIRLLLITTSAFHFTSGQRFTALNPSIKRNWCTIETLYAECDVGGAGSSGRVVVSVSRNGFRILELQNNQTDESGVWSQAISLNFTKYGPGSYQLACSDGAYPWTSVFDVHDARGVAPDFEKESGHETVSFKEGELEKRLVCDVAGEPKAAAPDISWSYPSGLGLKTVNLGYEAILTRPPAGRYSLRCRATNCYGKTATKDFTVNNGAGTTGTTSARDTAGTTWTGFAIGVAMVLLTISQN